MTARVLGVMADSNFAGSKLYVTGSMSTNTGRAPRRAIEPAVATKVNGVVTTSSPGPTPYAIRARSSASEPEAQPSANSHPTNFAISPSSAATSDPMMNCWLSRTRATTENTSSRMGANWDLKSRNATGCSFSASSATETSPPLSSPIFHP